MQKLRRSRVSWLSLLKPQGQESALIATSGGIKVRTKAGAYNFLPWIPSLFEWFRFGLKLVSNFGLLRANESQGQIDSQSLDTFIIKSWPNGGESKPTPDEFLISSL